MKTQIAILVFYSFLWILMVIIHLKKTKRFDVVAFIYVLFLFGGICSISLMKNSYILNTSRINIVPTIYLFFCLCLSVYPIRSNSIDIKRLENPSQFVIKCIAGIIIFNGLLILPRVITSLRSGITMMIMDDSAGMLLYQSVVEQADMAGKGIGSLPTIIFNAFSDIGILFFFYYLSFPKTSRKGWITLGLAMGLLLSIAQPLANGLRGLVVMELLTMAAAYLLFKERYSDSVKRVVRITAIVLGVLVSIPMVLITTSRFGDDSSFSFINYSGQAVINFNEHGLNANGIRNGDRVVPLFKKMVGFKNVPNNYMERRQKYQTMTMDDSVFSTFVGDFTLDFGPFFGLIAILIMAYLVKALCKYRGSTIPFYKIVPLYFIICVCVQGSIYLFSYGDIGGNLKVVVYILVYLFLKYYKNEKKSDSFISPSISSYPGE